MSLSQEIKDLKTVWLQLYINYLMEHLHTSIDGMIEFNWYRLSPVSPSIPLIVPLTTIFFFYPISVLFCFCWVCVAHAVTANLLFLIIFWENFSNSSSYTDDCLNIRGNESKKKFLDIWKLCPISSVDCFP